MKDAGIIIIITIIMVAIIVEMGGIGMVIAADHGSAGTQEINNDVKGGVTAMTSEMGGRVKGEVGAQKRVAGKTFIPA